jgi:hypothetical protein
MLYIYSSVYWGLCIVLVFMHFWYLFLMKCCDFQFCFSMVNFFEVINYIGRVVMLILIILCFNKTTSLYGDNFAKTIKLDRAADCSDYVGNIILKDFIKGLASSITKHDLGITLTYVALGIWGFLFILLIWRRCKHI